MAETTIADASTPVELSSGRSVWVIEGDGAGWALLRRPGPVDAATGVAVTVVLSRHPRPGDEDIGHLVDAAVLTAEVTVAPTAAEHDELGTLPAIVRGGSAELIADGDVISRVPVATAGTATIGCTADGELASRLLAAVRGRPDPDLVVRLSGSLLVEPAAARVEVSGAWSDLHDALGGVGAPFDRELLGAAARRLIEDEHLTVRFTDEATDGAVQVDAAVEAAVHALWRQRRMLTGIDDDAVLGLRPAAGHGFTATTSTLTGRRVGFESITPLSELASPPAGSAHVVLTVTPTATGGGGAVAPRRRAPVPRAGKRPLVSLGGAFATPDLIVSSGKGVHASLPASTALLRPGLGAALVVADAVRRRPGPLVRDLGADSWPDRHDAALSWVAVEPVLDPESFRFELHRDGVLADGSPALTADVSLGFDLVAVDGNLAGEQRVVAHRDVTAVLGLTYRDADNDNAESVRRVPGSVTEADGRYTVRFSLLNQWCRIAYRCLALADDDAPPARLDVGYAFYGYQREVVRRPPVKLWGAAKTLLGSNRVGLVVPREAVAVTRAGTSVVFDRTKSIVSPPPQLHPQLELQPASETRTVRRRFERTATSDAAWPCGDHPDRFVQESEHGWTAIGCTSALALGTTSFVAYRELTGLRHDRYRVYQSQVVPGSFLVVPSHYRIGRRPADETPASMRPLIVLHAGVSADPDDVEIVLEVGLQPDLRPIDLRRLRSALRELHPAAELRLPTEVPDATSTCQWSIAGSLADSVSSVALPDGTVHAAFRLGLSAWLILRTSLSTGSLVGSIRFDLGDGSSVSSTLDIDLRSIVGPWGRGPIGVSVESDRLTIRNDVDVPIEVDLVETWHGDSVGALTPVSAVLSPGSSFDAGAIDAGGEPLVDYRVRSGPASIEELRTFVEDVEVSAVLVTATSITEPIIVECELDGTSSFQSVELSDQLDAEEVRFLMPLTSVLAGPVLRYRVIAGSAESEWRTHALSESAFVIITHPTQQEES